MYTLKNEEIGIKLIKGIKLTKEEITYLQKYWKEVGYGRKLTEKEVLATDYHKLSTGYRSLQTSMAGWGHTVTGKGKNYNAG